LVCAYSYSIKPGGEYTVNVVIKKPPFLRLKEDSWEVRAYFYEGLNCFNAGRWTEIGIYDGWWKYRYKGGDWTDPEETRTVSITVRVVDYPRPPEDRMAEIPVDGSVRFRIRTIIYLDEKPHFAGPEGEESEAGRMFFLVGGVSFQYQFVKRDDEYLLEGFEGKVDRSAAGKWRLIVDKDLRATVSMDAPGWNVFSVEPIELNLETAARAEDTLELPSEVKIIAGITTVVVVVGIVVYIAFKKRGEEIPFVEQ
jgi:hypothetical protein